MSRSISIIVFPFNSLRLEELLRMNCCAACFRVASSSLSAHTRVGTQLSELMFPAKYLEHLSYIKAAYIFYQTFFNILQTTALKYIKLRFILFTILSIKYNSCTHFILSIFPYIIVKVSNLPIILFLYFTKCTDVFE